MRAHYSVTRDPRQTLIGGASAGGVAAAYAGLLYPRIFGNILAQSGGFNSSPEQMRDWMERSPAANAYEDRHVQEEVEDRSLVEGGWLAKQFIQSTKLPLKFYLDAGVFEASLGGFIGTLDASRHMRDVLLAKGYEVHYQEFIGGHDYLSWRGTLADGLIALIGKKQK
jgi:enterochelin esterase family protein